LGLLTHKLNSAPSLWFKFYCQRWKTSQSHKQSRTLGKWYYIGNGAR